MKLRFLVFFAFLFLSACSSRKNVLLPAGALQPALGKVSLIWYSNSSHARVYRQGSGGVEGLAALWVNNAVGAGMESRVEKEEIAPLVKDLFIDSFTKSLEEKGFQVSSEEVPIPYSALPKLENKGDIPPVDVSPVIEESPTYVFLLTVYRFGTERSYAYFIPTGDPKAVSDIDVYLIKFPENKVIAEQHPRLKLDVIGQKWDDPPKYFALLETMRQSFADAMQEAKMNFMPE